MFTGMGRPFLITVLMAGLALAMVAAITVVSSTTEITGPGAAQAGESQEVTRDEWLKSFPFEVVDYFCQESMFFMQCFEVTPHECIQVASSAVDACLEYMEAQLPDTLDKDARDLWGARLVSCAGSVYEQALRKRLMFKDGKKCTDPSRWGQESG